MVATAGLKNNSLLSLLDLVLNVQSWPNYSSRNLAGLGRGHNSAHTPPGRHEEADPDIPSGVASSSLREVPNDTF